MYIGNLAFIKTSAKDVPYGKKMLFVSHFASTAWLERMVVSHKVGGMLLTANTSTYKIRNTSLPYTYGTRVLLYVC